MVSSQMKMFMMSLNLMQTPSLIAMILFLLYAFLRQLRRLQKLSENGRRSRGPPQYPIIGCLIPFYSHRSCLLDWYTQLLSESETNTIVVKRLGARRTVVTANPDNVEYLLKTNFNNYPKGKPFTEILGDFLGDGIFNVDGDLWRAQRKLASHEFSSTKSLKEFVMKALEEEVGSKLVPVLQSAAARDGRPVDLQELLRRLAFNLICRVSLGVLDPNSESLSQLNRAFDVASEICARRGAAPVHLVWKMKRLLRVGSEWKLREAVDEIHGYVAEMIEEKKRKMEQDGDDEKCGEDLLSKLIMGGHEGRVIREMVISFIMAGRDTTSAAMTWLFWLLSCHPETEQQLVQETMKVGGDQCLDYESVKEFKLLEACLNESMRLYPPVVWDSKHAVGNDILPDGVPVNGGDRVTYFPYGMGRMETLWGQDRLEFRPSRWDEMVVSPFKFPVFHAGPRVCLGKDMAVTQMKYVVASLIRQFQFRPVKAGRPVCVPFLTAHMAGGLNVWVQHRDRRLR